MEGRADYPSLLERERQLYAGLSAAAAAARGLAVGRPAPGFAGGPPSAAAPGPAESSAAGLTSSIVRQQLSELARASTPLPPDPLTQLHARYLPHGLPLHNRGYSLMGQFLSNGSTSSGSAEAFKSMLGPGLDHYWSHLSDAMLAEGHQRFGAGGYPPYLPLLSPSESLSLFASHASSSVSQSSPIHHRIYDLHKESLLANGLGHLAGSSSGLSTLGPPSSSSPPLSAPRTASVSSRMTPTSSANEGRAPSRDDKLSSRSSDPARRSGSDVRSHSRDGRQVSAHDRHDVRRASYDGGAVPSGSRYDARCNSLDGRLTHSSRSSSLETCRTKQENRSLSLDAGKHPAARSRDREIDSQRHEIRGRDDYPRIKRERSPSYKSERHSEGNKSEIKHRHLEEHNITIRHEGKEQSDKSHVQYVHKLKSPDRTMKESKSSKEIFSSQSSNFTGSPFKKDQRTPVKEMDQSVVLDLRSPGPIVDIKIDSPSDSSVGSPQQVAASSGTGSGCKSGLASRTEVGSGCGISARSTQAEIVIMDSPPSGAARSTSTTTMTTSPTTYSSKAGGVFTSSSKLSPPSGLSVGREGGDGGSYIVHHQQAVIAISRSPTNPGRGSPQEGGKVHATTFTPEVGTVAGWYAPSRPPKSTTSSCVMSSVTSPSSTTTVTVKSSNSPIMQDRITSPVSRPKPAQSRSKAISPSFKVSCIKQESSPPSCSISFNSVKQEDDPTSEHSRSSESRDGSSHSHRTSKLCSSKDSFICSDIPKLIKPDKHETGDSSSTPFSRPLRTSEDTRPRRQSAESRAMPSPLDGATKIESPAPCAKMSHARKEPMSLSDTHGRLVGYGGTSEPPIGQPALAIPSGLILPGFPHPTHLDRKQLFGSGERVVDTPEVRVKTEDKSGNGKQEGSKTEKTGDQQHLARGKVELPGPGQEKCALRSTLLRPENTSTRVEDVPALSAGAPIPVGIAIARQRDEPVSASANIISAGEKKSGDKDDAGGSCHPWQPQAERQQTSAPLKSEAAIGRPLREGVSGGHDRDLSPNVTRDSRPTAANHLGPNLVVTSQASAVHGFSAAEGLAAPPWMTGPPVWLQPGYPLPHPGAPTAIPVDPAHIPVTPPTGYKLAQDSLTGHLYFVPEAVLEQSSKWGSNFGVNQPPVVISHPLSHPHILPQAPILPGQSTTQAEPPERPGAVQQQRITPVQTWPPPKQEVKPHKQEVVTPGVTESPPAAVKVLAPPPSEGISQKACKDGMALQKHSSLQSQRTLARAPPLKATVAPQQHHRQTKQEPQSPTDLPGLPVQEPTPASTAASSQPPAGSIINAETTSTTTTSAEDSSSRVGEDASRNLQVSAVLPGIPVAPGQPYPLVYPSTMPYLCDPNLVQLRGVAMPPTSKPSTQDRACSPIIFPPSITTTDSSSNTTEVLQASTSVQTVAELKKETSDTSIQTCDNNQPFQCHTCQTRQDSEASSGPPKFERSTSTKGVADYLFDLSGPILSQLANEESGQNSPAPSLPSTPSCFSPVARFLDDKSSCGRSLEGATSDLISTIPQVSQASDGLELLSILAEHAQKQQVRSTKSECDDTEEEEDTPDINKNYNIPKPHMVEPKRERKDSISSSSRQQNEYESEPLEEYVQGGFRITAAGIDGMDVLELEMRMRLAELQRRYKEKQRELARLQPRREEDRNRDRGPGRPGKRKSKSKSSDSCSKSPRSDATTDTDTSTTAQPIVKKKKLHTPQTEDKPSLSKPTSVSSSSQAVEKSKTPGVSQSTPGKQSESSAKPTIKKKTPATPSSSITTSQSPAPNQPKSSDKVVKPAVIVTSTPVKTKTAAVKSKTPAKTPSRPEKSSTAATTPVSQTKKRPSCDTDKTPVKKTLVMKKEKSRTPKESSDLRKKEEQARRMEESDEREEDSDDSQIEDVSWLFDEDEINPPEDVLSGISHASKDAKPSSAWSPDGRNSLSSSQSETGMLSHFTSSSTSDMSFMRTSVAAATSAALKSKKRKKSPDDTGLEDSEFDDNPVKKRKPGRPKKLESDGSTETIVSRKHEHKQMALLSMKPQQQKTPKKTKPKASDRKSEKEEDDSEEDTGPVLKDEWFIRRSERIFLSDPILTAPVVAEPTPKTTSSTKTSTSAPASATALALKSKVNREKSQVKMLHEASQQVKKKYTKTLSYTPAREKSTSTSSSTTTSTVTTASTSSSTSNNKPCPYDYPSSSSPSSSSSSSSSSTPSSSDSDSSSDADNVPLSTLRERPATPKPRSCVIEKEELKDGLPVLFFMEGLFYEAQVKGIQPPDVYGVLVDGERGNRPHIMSQEELLNQAILDVQPASLQWLTEGTRVCAYWSQQFSCLYPGTVAKGSPNPDEDKGLICLEFDDGDSGRIPLEHIRMLPKDYPIVDIDPNPLIVMGGRRRRRTMSEDGKERPEGKSRTPSITDTLSSYHLAEEALFKRHSPAKVPKKKSPESGEQKMGNGADTSAKTEGTSGNKASSTLPQTKSNSANNSKASSVTSTDKPVHPVTSKPSAQVNKQSTNVVTSKSSLSCGLQNKPNSGHYSQSKLSGVEVTGSKSSTGGSGVSTNKAAVVSSSPKQSAGSFTPLKSPIPGTTCISTSSSSSAAATTTCISTKPTLTPSKLSSTILTATKQALTFTAAKPSSVSNTTSKTTSAVHTPIKQNIMPGKLTSSSEKKKIQSILKDSSPKKGEMISKQIGKAKERPLKDKLSQKAEEAERRGKDGSETTGKVQTVTPKKGSTVSPLTVDTKSMSVSSVSVGSKGISPGSTCTISPGGGSELTMRIRTNSCEGAEFTRRTETSEESESSTNSSDKSSEQTSETTGSTSDDEDSRSSDFSDSEESCEATAEGGTTQNTPSTSASTQQGSKKVSPASSTSSTGKPARRKERNLSGEKSKIAAFLPARQLWRWSGKGTKRPGMKGRAKKEYFKAIQRGKEILRVGDCAVFLSTGRPHLPYVGRIESLWEAWGGNMVVKVKWFYHPEETKGGKRLAEVRGALYQSPHVDENDVQTISHRCEVVPYSTYRLHKQAKGSAADADNNDLYYLAGTYDPTIGMITFESDVKVL